MSGAIWVDLAALARTNANHRKVNANPVVQTSNVSQEHAWAMAFLPVEPV
jgi:hypothetical protein